MPFESDPDELYREVVSKYANHINPGLAKLMSFAGFGVEMYGEGCYVHDQSGRKYLDFLGGYGVFSLGHRHPRVVEAVKSQLDRMGLSSKAFFCKPAADLAERLSKITPPGLEFTFFCNSGTEAVEGALKMAKGATGRSRIVSTEGSYHGKTLGALSVTGREKYRKRFEPLLPDVEFVEYGDAGAAAGAINSNTACMIVEPIQGEGGIQVPPDGYLRALRIACDKSGALLIADEVQTGFARTGEMFACDREAVAPDILTMAKAIGGGVMPLGCFSGTREIWEEVFGQNPLAHTSTFGGNALACAAGLATLDVIEDEDLVARANRLGAILRGELIDLQLRHSDLIGEVRGRGLMLGVEFREDEVGELVVAQLLKRGMFVAYTLNNPRVLRIEPPLILTENEIELGVSLFDEAVTETEELLTSLV